MGANSKKTPITIGIVPVSALSAECRIESILSKNYGFINAIYKLE